MEILPSKRFESHSQSANGLERPYEVKNDKHGPCHGADFYKNDTLSRSRNPESDTLSSGTSPYRKILQGEPEKSFPQCNKQDNLIVGDIRRAAHMEHRF